MATAFPSVQVLLTLFRKHSVACFGSPCGLPGSRGSWPALVSVALSLLTLMGELCEDMCLESRPKDRGCFSEIDTTVYHHGCQNTGNACCELSIEGGQVLALHRVLSKLSHLQKDQCLSSPSPACQ